MRIGIIGAGNIGATLAAQWTRAGHEVVIANSRGPQTLADVAERTGALPGTVDEAAEHGEVVVVAIPYFAQDDLPSELLAGTIVIDAGNYFPQRDGQIADLDDGSTTSTARFAAGLPGARVTKAYNTITSANLRDLGRPAGDPDRLAIPIAGDDDDAVATVIGLIDETGFDVVWSGTLDQSGRQEPGSPVYAASLTRPDLAAALET